MPRDPRAWLADIVAACDLLRKRHDIHAGEREAFEEPGGVFLVATESVERFRRDYVESAVQGIAHQRLESCAQERRTGDGVVRVLLADRPALSFGESAAHAQLIGDRSVALVV